MNDCNMETGPWGVWSEAGGGGWVWMGCSPVVMPNRELARSIVASAKKDGVRGWVVKPIEQTDVNIISE